MSRSDPSGPRDDNPRRRLADVLTPAMEDYLKTIYKLQGDSDRATTIAIAQRMGISPASVTNMLRKLGDLGLIEYRPYQGARLTPVGRRIALEIIRHHRLLELYLTEHIGFSWDQVDAEAEQLEHVISEEFEERIDRMLGHPRIDPHGAPIPTPEGHISKTRYLPLSDVERHGAVVVRRVSDRNAEALRRLGQMGLFPGVRLLIRERDIGGFQIQVEGEDRVQFLPLELAHYVYVEPASRRVEPPSEA
ncbi:MAG: hypothetical protein KatS3mg115_0183 [Candidatus Poribacteria bacterium]|nr:MAG: hypothetical protein KatS3mg115_0183 [Candidatus Poribacteria bacterium]